MKKQLGVISTMLLLAALVAVVFSTTVTRAQPKAEEDPAVARTRKQVKMLDDLYKTAVVMITKHYVNDEDDFAAGSAAVALFAAMKEKGWHEVRLLDATGEPIENKNLPRDDFEKAAVKELSAGKPWHEAVVKRENKTYYRAATPIPVVLDRCIMCHAHYEDFKKDGKIIGVLSYTLPVE
jgi:hypothetical protein